MSAHHDLSDSGSDTTIDPTQAQVLASDTESDSSPKRAAPRPRIPHSRSLHEISESDSDDESIIPPTQPVKKPQPTSIKKSLFQPKPKVETAKKKDNFSSGDHSSPRKSVVRATSLHELSDSDGDNTDLKPGPSEPELTDLVSPVKGGSLGRKLSRDPTIIQQWAGGQSQKRARADEDGRPMCKDGKMCTRKSQGHFLEYRHPESKKPKDEWPVEKKPRLHSPSASNSNTSFNFFLTKVQGIAKKYNEFYSMDIKDILSPSMGNLQKSAQFSYMFDIPWLVTQYPPSFRKLPLTVVHGFQRQEKKALEGEAKPYPNIKLCRGKLEILYGTHHTKMMLLQYDAGLRVVITTANLIGKDWAQKTQGMWMSPVFPRLGEESATKGDSVTRFKRDLLEYLSVYSDPEMNEWTAAVRQHDMSAARVYLIASVPGRHKGAQRSCFGHLKLQKLLHDHGPRSEDVHKWPIAAQFSSVGSLGASADAWLDGEFRASLASTRGTKNPMKPSLKLVYPSKANVRESLEGYPAGASLPYSINTAKKQTWLHTFWHHWYSEVRGRSQACPHIKTYLRASPDWTQLAWFVVTSANMSKAAWGALEKAGSQLMVRSYELGVLFLPESFGFDTFEALRTDTKDPNASNVFPVPYDLPPTHYDIKVDRPWVWDIPYVDKPDTHGNKWCPT